MWFLAFCTKHLYLSFFLVGLSFPIMGPGSHTEHRVTGPAASVSPARWTDVPAACKPRHAQGLKAPCGFLYGVQLGRE